MDNKEWNKFLSDRYGLEGHHFWKHKQSGKWIISHKGCMIIADQEGVVFSKPQYVKTESDNVVLYGTAIITTHDDAGQIVDKKSGHMERLIYKTATYLIFTQWLKKD